MNTYFLNNQKIITNLRLNRIYEVSRAVISYPYSFTNKIRKISQEFIVGSEFVPAFDPNLTHPIFNQAFIINQTEAQIEPAGFCRFSREYIEFIGGEITTNPTTISYTFPSVWEGNAFHKRNASFTTPANFKPVRENSFTTNIPVTEKWELINVSNETQDTETPLADIPVGSKIGYGGYNWSLIQNNGTSIVIQRYDSSAEEYINDTISGGYIYYNSDPDFEKISKIQPFSIYDNVYSSDVSSYLSSIGLSENPARVSVDFVDNNTIPDTETFLKDIKLGTKFPLQESEIEHLGGYIYIRKTLYGKLL